MVETPECPVRRVVAGLALRTQSARVRVFRRVARVAVLGRVMKRQCCMTGLTSDRFVRADQREMRETVIEAHVRGPGHLRVTALALTPELTDVGIVRMTARAIDGQVRVCPIHMTRRAFERVMCTAERKAIDLTMVEAGVRPSRNSMTTTAIRSQSAHVDVVGLMTAVATGG